MLVTICEVITHWDEDVFSMFSQMIPESILTIFIMYLSLAPAVKPEKVIIYYFCYKEKGTYMKCSGTF